MTAIPDAYLGFWAMAQRAHPGLDAGRFYESFAFGDSEAMATELADLVLKGIKRATASLLWSYEVEARTAPRAGDFSIVTSWARQPLCVIETTAVHAVPFDAVDEAFARAEGEGDGSLAYWRRGHTAFFARECARIGRTPAPDMPVLCEHFHVVFRPADTAPRG